MGDVRPLEETRRRGFRRRAGAGVRSGDGPAFIVRSEGSSVYARREGTPPEVLDKLGRGRPPAANRLDLHGMSEESARQHVFRFVRQSNASGLKCVALVTGRGLRSPAGAVLKRAVPSWLTQLPLASAVVAFASAPPELGGDGVVLVLLAARGTSAG